MCLVSLPNFLKFWSNSNKNTDESSSPNTMHALNTAKLTAEIGTDNESDLDSEIDAFSECSTVFNVS